MQGGKDGEKTITDMFRRDAYVFKKESPEEETTFDILRKMVAAVNESSLAKTSLPGMDLFDNDGLGSGKMPKLQQQAMPEVMKQGSAEPAPIRKAAAASSSSEANEAVSNVMQSIARAIEPQQADDKQIDHQDDNHEMAVAAPAADFDLFGLG